MENHGVGTNITFYHPVLNIFTIQIYICHKAFYVKIDECDCYFLPPAPCSAHRSTGHDAMCLNCISAVQPGVFAVKSLSRKFKYYYDRREKNYITIQRKQFPLIPALAMTLYSMQGTTAEIGMFAF